MQIELPDGVIAEFPDGMPQAEIEKVLRQQFGSPSEETGLSPMAQAYRLEGSEGKPGFGEELLGGAKHGWDRMAYGLKEAVGGELSPEEQSLLRQGKEFVGNTGWGSTAGQIGSEVLASAPIAGGVAGLGGKALAEAFPAMRALGSAGGPVMTPGLVGKAATQGAVSGALAADPEGNKLQNATIGALAGGVLPAAGVGANALMSTAGGLARFGAKSLPLLHKALSTSDDLMLNAPKTPATLAIKFGSKMAQKALPKAIERLAKSSAGPTTKLTPEQIMLAQRIMQASGRGMAAQVTEHGE
ncbi:MAG: hypothetical protein E6Q97_17865 [Desulfurellales bacterium]|nr:MAG: hypothetical protein E6Q97_17865 [Desulfurellales bacterium]